MRTFTRRGAVGTVSALACLLTAAGVTSPAHADSVSTPPANPGVVVPLAQAGLLTGWGSTTGSLGDLSLPESLQGVPVTSVSVGSGWALASTATGQIVTWGSDTAAAPALPSTLDPATLVQLSAVGSAAAAAVTSDGHVTTWLGGDTSTAGDWLNTSTLTDVASIAVGTNTLFGVALTHAGTVHTWGVDNGTGKVTSAVPGTLTNVTQVAACGNTGLALTSDGAVHAWGANTSSLVDNAPTSGVARIACVTNTAIALKTDGTVTEWGNTSGMNTVPAALTAAGADVTSIAASFGGIVARNGQGSMWAWGSASLSPVPVPAQLTSVAISELAPGSNAVYALTPAVIAVGKPTIAGTAKVGETLTATDTAFSGAPAAVAGQWYANGTAITGATETTYKPTSAEVGKTLTYRDIATVTGSDPVIVESDPTATVAPDVAPASTVAVTTSPTSYGKAGSATVKVTSSGAVGGSVAVTVDGAAAGTATLTGGSATIALPATLAAGSHTVGAAYAGNATSAPANGSATLAVAKASSTTKVKLPKKAKKGKKAKATVTVTASGGAVTGMVTVKIGKAKATGTVKNGKATVKVKLAKAGKQKVKVTYAGDANVTGSKAKAILKVK